MKKSHKMAAYTGAQAMMKTKMTSAKFGLQTKTCRGVHGSPVMRTPYYKSVGFSTSGNSPSFQDLSPGSPVLTQRVSTIRKRARKPSLLPLSPITPGCSCDSPHANLSRFSVHVHQQSNSGIHSTLDETPLAVPLEDSDNDGTIEELNETVSHVADSEDNIDILTTQTTDVTSDFLPRKVEHFDQREPDDVTVPQRLFDDDFQSERFILDRIAHP
uniref:Uncharacterized protein n=1 Tax=Ciona savignyi TaxID=51511 RepID=H2YBX8_CIOSA